MDDDHSVYDSMSLLLSHINIQLDFFKHIHELQQSIDKTPPLCLLIELNLKPYCGLDIYQSLSVPPPTIFLSTYCNTKMAVKVMQTGAIDLIEKPFSEQRLITSIKNIIDKPNHSPSRTFVHDKSKFNS